MLERSDADHDTRDHDHDDVASGERRDRRAGLDAARSRFGGLDVPASLAGMLVALALLILLAGLVSAASGAIAFRSGTIDLPGSAEEVTFPALITAGVVIFVAFLFGGWSAGRMARYSGGLNGAMVAIWFVVLLIALALLGAVAGDAYNLFGDLRVADASLPDWFSTGETTAGTILSSLAFAAVMVIGAVLGGLWGTHLHRMADRTIADTSGRHAAEA